MQEQLQVVKEGMAVMFKDVVEGMMEECHRMYPWAVVHPRYISNTAIIYFRLGVSQSYYGDDILLRMHVNPENGIVLDIDEINVDSPNFSKVIDIMSNSSLIEFLKSSMTMLTMVVEKFEAEKEKVMNAYESSFETTREQIITDLLTALLNKDVDHIEVRKNKGGWINTYATPDGMINFQKSQRGRGFLKVTKAITVKAFKNKIDSNDWLVRGETSKGQLETVQKKYALRLMKDMSIM
jgi:hypothetical protein